MLSFESQKRPHGKTVLSRDTKGLSRSKKKDGERFLQKERERVRGDYIPCDKPELQLSGRPVANATYETIERPRYYQILVRLQPKNFFRQSPCPIVPDDAAMLDVWLSKCAYYFLIFVCRTTQNLCGPPNVPPGCPGFFFSWQHCQKMQNPGSPNGPPIWLMGGWLVSVLGSPPINSLLRPSNQ